MIIINTTCSSEITFDSIIVKNAGDAISYVGGGVPEILHRTQGILYAKQFENTNMQQETKLCVKLLQELE